MGDVFSKRLAFLFLVLSLFDLPLATAYHSDIISIDFGNTYSRVGVYWHDGFYENGTVEILKNDAGDRMIPSVVAFTDDGILVGDAAKDQVTDNPERTIFGIKRLLGRKYDDPDVQRDMKYLPYKVVNKDGKPYIEVNVKGANRLVSPEEICSLVLRRLKEMAESYTRLRYNITRVAVTVPASFSDDQMVAFAEAASMAGLRVYDITEEPLAAAFAYGPLENMRDKKILVYDLGGSTLDVSILGFAGGDGQVLATRGDPRLGGENVDGRMMDYFIKQFKIKYGRDMSSDNRTLEILRMECERAKRALSRQHLVKVQIDLFDKGTISEFLTRVKFEELNMDLFNKTIGPVRKVLEDARLKESEIDQVFLVGGSSRIPVVHRLVKDFFGGKKKITMVGGPHKFLRAREWVEEVVPEEAVVYGLTVDTYINNYVSIDYDHPYPHDEL